jgi:hypothetical protein
MCCVPSVQPQLAYRLRHAQLCRWHPAATGLTPFVPCVLLLFLLLLPPGPTGGLPVDWGVLTASASVDLSYNQLSGTVPVSWGALKQGSLANNKGLTGCAPAAWNLPGREVTISGTGIKGTCA